MWSKGETWVWGDVESRISEALIWCKEKRKEEA